MHRGMDSGGVRGLWGAEGTAWILAAVTTLTMRSTLLQKHLRKSADKRCKNLQDMMDDVGGEGGRNEKEIMHGTCLVSNLYPNSTRHVAELYALTTITLCPLPISRQRHEHFPFLRYVYADIPVENSN